MPTYRVETNRGTFEIEANREPSPAEIEAYVNQQQAPEALARPAPVARVPVPPAQPVPTMQGSSTLIDIGGMAQNAGRSIGNAINRFTGADGSPGYDAYSLSPELMAASARAGGMSMAPPMNRNAAAAYVRATPIVAAAAFPPAGLAGFAGLGATGAASELAAQQIEGNDPASRKGLAQAVKSFALSAAPIPGMRAASGIGSAALQGAKMAAGNMATEAVAETAKRSIDAGKLATYDNLADAWKDTRMSGAFGGLMGTVGSRIGGIAQNKAAYEAREQLLAEVGAKNPTLAMKNPGLTGWEQHVASRDPALAEKIAAARSDITKEFYNQIGDLKGTGDPELAAKINPLIPVVDEAEVAYKTATEQAQKAKQALAQAQQATNLPPAEKAKIQQEASASLLNAVNAQAVSTFKANAQLGDLVTNTAKAKELASTFKNLIEARTEISKGLYGAAGVDEAVPLFNKTELEQAARTSLGADAETVTGRSILAQISRATEGDTPLTLAQLRDARNHLSAEFADKAPGAMDNAERLARQAYEAMTDVSRQTIAATYGSQAISAYDEASRFWRDTAQAQGSPLGRALLNRQGGEAADSTLRSIASGMADGNVDELDKFKEFVGTIGQYNKPVADQAIQTMQGALKNAFINKHSKGEGLDVNGLLSDLAKASAYEKLPFPVQALGFGDVTTIKDVQKALKVFKPEDINNVDVVNSVLENPAVQRAIKNGGSDTTSIVRNATAHELFERELQRQTALAYAGKTKEARDAARAAEQHALTANLTEAEREAALARAKNDPVLSAFSGMGTYKLMDEAEKTGRGSVTHLLGQMPRPTAASLMSGLRQNNPQMAEMVERRLMANEMKGFVKMDKALPEGAGVMDTDAIRNYFNPSDYEQSRVRWLRNVVGDDKVNKLKSFVTKVGELNDQMRRGTLPTDRDVQGLATVIGASTGAVAGINPLQRIAFLNRIMAMANTKSYNALSALILDRDLAGKVYRSAGPLSEAISSLPTQKAYMLMLDKPLAEELGKHNRTP